MGRWAGYLLLLFCCAACRSPADAVRLVVVEEHQEAWAAMEQARSDGVLPPGALLIHLDAHEDLGMPDLKEALPDPVDPETARRLTRSEMSVDELVLPALFTGTVGEFVWVYPPWLSQSPLEEKRFVGSHRGRRTEIVSGVDLSELQFPDRRTYRARWLPLAGLPSADSPVVLDIDLDFFACENPHSTHTDVAIDRAEYERLLSAGTVRYRGEAEDGGEHIESVVLDRPAGPFEWPVRLDRIRDSATGVERYARGFMCMGEYRDAFPVHRPSPEEIEARVGEVASAIRRAGLRPVLITIARSARSGFVPPGQVDAIQERVISALLEIYPGLQVYP